MSSPEGKTELQHIPSCNLMPLCQFSPPRRLQYLRRCPQRRPRGSMERGRCWKHVAGRCCQVSGIWQQSMTGDLRHPPPFFTALLLPMMALTILLDIHGDFSTGRVGCPSPSIQHTKPTDRQSRLLVGVLPRVTWSWWCEDSKQNGNGNTEVLCPEKSYKLPSTDFVSIVTAEKIDIITNHLIQCCALNLRLIMKIFLSHPLTTTTNAAKCNKFPFFCWSAYVQSLLPFS